MPGFLRSKECGGGGRETPDSDGGWAPDWAVAGQQKSCQTGLVLALM